jgi:murein DD-endopeptidase MepM/ murein hydrolase activator NlpD
MRWRVSGAFALGVIAGALALLYALWRTGGLVPGSLLARRTPDLAAGRSEPPLSPLPTIPFPIRGPSPAAAGTPPPAAADQAIALSEFSLAGEPMRLPVEGARVEDLKDDFHQARGGGTRQHEAIDIHAPRGTPVVAAVDGRVVKLFTSRQGGLTMYEFDTAEKFSYYYAHLDRYAENLKEGDAVRRGDRLGYVGTTGDAPPESPHLHFAIYRLGPEKHWWQGLPIDPYPLLIRGH